MIGNSLVGMAVVDVVIIAFTMSIIVLFIGYKKAISSLHLTKALSLIVVGMVVMSSVYVADLYSMTVMPILSGYDAAMTFMRTLHSDYKWYTTLGGVTLISFGMIYLFSTLLPKLNSRIRDAAMQLVNIEQQFATIYHETPSIFITVDCNGAIKAINKYGAKVLSLNPHTISGVSIFDLICSQDIAIEKSFINKALLHSEKVMDIEIRLKKNSDEVLWVNQSARITIDPTGQKHLLLACQDISTAKELSFKLHHQANHDELTALPNRRALSLHLEHLLDKTKRNGSKHTFLYIDLDQLKVVNDTCGHIAGDSLLKQLSLVIKGAIREQDICARIGGDEFAILLEHCNSDEGFRTAEIIRKQVEEFNYVWNRHSFKQSISIGLVEISYKTVDTNLIMSCADAACYEAKEQGRNRTVIYQAKGDQDPIASHEEMFWVRRLQRGMTHNQLQLYFQPIVKSNKSTFDHLQYEILVRYIDKNGIISPSVFLPAAERFNLTDQIDIWVIKKTIEFLKQHPEHTEKLSCCSINLSTASLTSLRVQDKITDLIVKSGFPANKLCFEITENSAVSNLNDAQQFMQRLRHIGVKFALDDFGSGVSSLGYLKQLPIDFLKIDGIFVRDVAEDKVDRAMVSAINNVGHELGIKTVAEYVESDDIENVLMDIGVDFVQGFHKSKPRPFAEIEHFYAA